MLTTFKRSNLTLFQYLILLLLGMLLGLSLIILGTGPEVVTWIQSQPWAIFWSFSSMIGLWLLPGLVILRWLWRGKPLHLDEQVMLALGIGMTIPPNILNLLSVVGLRWGSWQTWLYMLSFFALFIGQNRHYLSPKNLRTMQIPWFALSAILLIFAAGTLRLFMVRDLIVPMWNDSYHHTLITQLLADHGGLFNSWLPYADLHSFTYHYGFHANAVFLHWLAGINAPQSVLLFGQISNIASVACAYVLTTRLGGSRFAGVIAFVATGFINTMPLYYVNWGRYTQLIGQVLLVVMLITWMHVIESGWHKRGITLAILVTSGLVLTHYLVTLMGVVLLGSYLIIWLARDPRWPVIRRTIVLASTITFFVLIITLPWTLNLVEGRLTKIANNYVSGANAGYGLSVASFGALAPFFVKMPLIIAAVLGIWLGLVRRNWRILLCVVWSILLELLVVPYIFNIPLTGVFSAFAIAMTLYITIIPLAAYALADTFRIPARYQLIVSIVFSLLICTIILWSSTWQPYIINDGNTLLFTHADYQAMQWIKQSTPAEAKFLINGYPGYGRSVYIADDGGTWIPFFTGRQTTLPPMTYGTERGATPESVAKVREFYNTLYARPLPDPEGIKLCLDTGIDYIYIGPHVGTGVDLQRIAVQKLRYLPDQFPIVYERDGVIIFAIKESP